MRQRGETAMESRKRHGHSNRQKKGMGQIGYGMQSTAGISIAGGETTSRPTKQGAMMGSGRASKGNKPCGKPLANSSQGVSLQQQQQQQQQLQQNPVEICADDLAAMCGPFALPESWVLNDQRYSDKISMYVLYGEVSDKLSLSPTSSKTHEEVSTQKLLRTIVKSLNLLDEARTNGQERYSLFPYPFLSQISRYVQNAPKQIYIIRKSFYFLWIPGLHQFSSCFLMNRYHSWI